MVGATRLIILAILFLSFATSAHAFGGRFAFWRGTSSSYSAPPTYWVVPAYCLPSPRVLPVPDASPFARPTPAPPSQTAEPPIYKKTSTDPRMPVIVTSHAMSAGVTGGSPLAKNRVRVGFWNLAGRDVSLTVDGKTYSLAKDRAVTLDLERQFAWQIAGQPLHVERLPEAQTSHEVVIRE